MRENLNRDMDEEAADLSGDFEEEPQREESGREDGDGMAVDSIRSPKCGRGKRWDDHVRWVMSQTEASVAHIGVINIVSGTTPRD